MELNHEFLNKNGIHIIPVLKEFNDYLDKCDLVVGHNISFDKRLIFVECLRHKIDQNFTKFVNNQKICKPEYCTMKNSTQFCEIIKLSKTNKTYIKQPKLIELYSKLFLNEPVPKQLHNSLIDILCTLRCYLKYVNNIDIIEVNQKIIRMNYFYNLNNILKKELKEKYPKITLFYFVIIYANKIKYFKNRYVFF